MALDFDYNAARKAGYSDDQILKGLKASGDLDFDVDAALKQYSATDILQGLLPAPKAPEPAPEPSGVMGRIKDIGISALKGAISVPESAIGLADIVTGGAAGRGAEAIGFRPAEAKATLSEYYSPEQKAASQNVADAKGFLPTMGAMLANPSTLVQAGVESLPSMGAGGVVGRGILAVAPKIGALAGAAIGEGAVGAGQTAEQIRQQSADGSLSLGQSGAALASGIGTGAFAAVGGRLAQKLGISDIDTALVQAGAPAGSTRGVVRRMLEGGVSEGVFEELPQSIQEQMWQNAAMDKPLLEGVPENAAQGLLVGGLFGGIAGLRSKAKPATVNPDQPEAEAAPLLLGNTPDPFLSFPDGSVGRKSDAEAFINGLPESDREAARARMFGGNDLTPQDVTPEDVMQSASIDEAITKAQISIEQGTPEFRAQRDADIDAAWSQHVTDLLAQMNSNYDAAEQQRLEAELQGMMDQRVNQNVEQAEALTEAQGFDNPGPTAMQLAMQEAQARRVAATDAARQTDTIAPPQQGGVDVPVPNLSTNTSPAVNVQGIEAEQNQSPQGIEVATPNQQDTPAAQQQRPQAQADAEVAQAKAVLTAAGVTGNERMAALRSIRTGENTIEDLIDAHPPKPQEVVNVDRNAVDASGNGNDGGRGAGIPAGDGPVDGRGNVPAGSDGAGRQPVAGLDDSVAEQRGAAPDDNASPAADAQPALAPTNSLSRDSSWVIRNKATGEVMLETFDKKKVDALNTEKYEAVPVQQHLGEINTPGTLANEVARGEQSSTADEPAAQRTPVQSEVDRLRAGRDARIEAQRNKPKTEAQLATEAKYARQEAEIARAKENAEARKQAKEPAPAAEPAKPSGTVTERYLGRYGKGMSENNAKAEAAERNKNGDGTNWRVEANEELGYDRYEVVGYKDTTPRKSTAQPSGGMTAADVNKAIITLKAKWLGFTRVNVVQSVEDIPAAVQERAQADAGTEGIYDPQTKAVYLIADNIATPERAAWVAAHEVSHAGLRMLHDKSVNEALNIAGSNKFVKELAAAIQQDRGETSDSIATEEAIAELSAATEQDDFAALEGRYGVKVPAASRNGVIGAVARVYEAVKRFLASVMGKPVSAVSDADVRALIGDQQAAVEGRSQQEDSRDRGNQESGAEPVLQSRAPTPAQEVVPKWAENESDAVKAALRKAGIIYTEETFKQKVAKLKEGALKKLQYGILDQFAPIKDQLGRIPYVMARMAKNADGTLEALMLYGRPHLDADGGMLVDTTKKGFIETMQILNGEHDRFFSWMAGRRAEQLKKEGRENLFTDADISNLSTLNQGRMKDGSSREATYLRAQKDVAELNKSVLDIAEASGLIDGESRKVWASDFYVPFYRVMEEGVTGPSIKSGLVNQKSIKKLKGGTNNLGDLTQNMLMNWSTLLTASAKNRAAKASLEAAKQIGAATEADEATIRAMGKSASTKAVSYMDNGVNRWHVVEDDNLLAAISALEFNGYNNDAMRAMSWFKTTLTKLVTISPYFKVRNLIRDSLSVLAVSDINRNPLVNIKNGYSLMRNNDARAQMVAGGGIYRFGMTMEGNRAEHIKKLIDSGVPDDTILNTAEKMQKFFGKLWSAYEEVGDLSENVNRAALYQKLRNEGVSHLEASFEARDLMDFGLSGAWAGVRALNQILPFMNARLQGLRKLGVGYNDDPKRMMYVVGALTLATIALSLAFKDDDDFKKRSDSDRNNYWWFKVGGIAYRIPRPFEIGAAATAIDNFSALFYDSKNTNIDRFTTQMSELINGQLAMNPIPQVFRPLIDVYANKDAFSGRPIESMAMQRLRPEDRYTNNTSELARLLSKSGVFVDPVSLVAGTGVRQLSPVQIDSLIKGYFAGAGVFAVAGADGLLHHTLIDRGAALPVPLKTLTGSFAEDLPSNSSRYVDMLYKTAQDVEQTYASYQNAVKQGDIEKARGIMKDEGATIAKYHMIESLKKNESRIGQVIQRTMNDKTLTGEQKAETIRRLKAVQDKIARQLVAR